MEIKNNKMMKRGVFLLFFFLILSLVIIVTLFKIQILGYDEYQKRVIEQLTVETKVNPDRGTILDRNGTVLASNKTVWVLYVIPKKISDPEFVSRELSKIVNVEYETILAKVKKKGYKYQIIDTDLDEETTKKVRELISEHGLEDEIELNASSKRYYPLSSLASHTLGFVNADGVGIYGLEKVYNNILEGTNGKYITAQDAQSSDMPFQYEEFIESENSYNLVSTIDSYIQYQLELQLENAAIESGAQNRAAGIAMNPKTGEIYAMAVYPSFDLNEPYTLDELSQARLDEYEKDTKEYRNQYLNLLYSMWNNKAVTELYEPGSTFKLFTTSVALQTRSASLASSFTCTGALKIDGYYRAISCHKRTGHGTLNFAEALQQSCNPSMMKLAFSIGKETFYDYFKKFGYTEKTGVDLPSEALGYYHKYDDFSNVSLAVYSFGQTFKTTAIQQLRAVSVIANGGKLVTPHLLKEIVDNEGNTIYEYQEISEENKMPIICGGTGLYVKALLYDYEFVEMENDHNEYSDQSTEELYQRLLEVDPESTRSIHPNNRRRIVRALQLADSGNLKSRQEASQQHIQIYDSYIVGLTMDRELLKQRISMRVDRMMENGLLDEVTAINEKYDWDAKGLHGIGYKEFKDYFSGKNSLEKTVELIKTHTRQFAKRQYTWWNHQMPVNWYDVTEEGYLDRIFEDIGKWQNG